MNGLFLKLGCTLLLLVRFYIICVGVLVILFFPPSYLDFKRFYDVLYGVLCPCNLIAFPGI